jgi:hypothetical protein
VTFLSPWAAVVDMLIYRVVLEMEEYRLYAWRKGRLNDERKWKQID